MRLALVACASLFAAIPAMAQTGQPAGGPLVQSTRDAPQGPSEAGINAAGEPRICRRIESSANRTSARRVCLTAREWREYNRNSGS